MSNEAESEEQSTTAQEKEEQWRAGFEAMGRDPDTNSAEYAPPAALEVLTTPANMPVGSRNTEYRPAEVSPQRAFCIPLAGGAVATGFYCSRRASSSRAATAPNGSCGRAWRSWR